MLTVIYGWGRDSHGAQSENYQSKLAEKNSSATGRSPMVTSCMQHSVVLILESKRFFGGYWNAVKRSNVYAKYEDDLIHSVWLGNRQIFETKVVFFKIDSALLEYTYQSERINAWKKMIWCQLTSSAFLVGLHRRTKLTPSIIYLPLPSNPAKQHQDDPHKKPHLWRCWNTCGSECCCYCGILKPNSHFLDDDVQDFFPTSYRIWIERLWLCPPLDLYANQMWWRALFGVLRARDSVESLSCKGKMLLKTCWKVVY